MKQHTNTKRCLATGFESLEPRMVQAQFGIAWNDSTHLSMSFVPDQTAVADLRSDLVAALDAQMPRAVWQSAIFRAAQAWMQVANVNIGLTSDGGQAFGVPGATQNDSRFGDIRIGGYRMANSVMAVSVPPGDTAGTFTGDIFINTAVRFTPVSLQATMMHEFGHALGIGHSNDPLSVMYSHLNNRTQLAASDISAIRSLYGARTADLNELKKDNNTLSGATRIKYSQISSGYNGSTPLVAWGDLTTSADVDFFYVKGLLGYNGPMTIRLQTNGISLATPKLTILDGASRVLGTRTSVSESADTLSITLPSTVPDRRYFIRVESQAASSYRVGRYSVAVTFDGLLQPTVTPLQTVMRGSFEGLPPEKVDLLFKDPTRLLFDDDLHTNDGPLNATNLEPLAGQSERHFDVQGTLSDTTDVDYYRVKTPATGANWVLTATLTSSRVNAVLPRVLIQDANGVAISSQILANGNGTYTVQASRLPANQSYLLKVFSPTQQTGNYTLFTSFGTTPAVLNTFASGQIASSATPVTGTLYVAEPQLFNFLLRADGTAGSVTMIIRNSVGVIVEQLTARARDVSSSVSRLLAPGKYTVSYSATVPQSFSLRGSKLSDPMGPVLDSTTLTPQYVSPTVPNTYVYPDGTTSKISYHWLLLVLG